MCGETVELTFTDFFEVDRTNAFNTLLADLSEGTCLGNFLLFLVQEAGLLRRVWHEEESDEG